jgi:hypothetical protein
MYTLPVVAKFGTLILSFFTQMPGLIMFQTGEHELCNSGLLFKVAGVFSWFNYWEFRMESDFVTTGQVYMLSCKMGA